MSGLFLQRLLDVNYMGSVYVTRALIGGMKARKLGRIVFVSSQAGQLGLYGFTAYSASKFALRGLAESLQMEVGHAWFSHRFCPSALFCNSLLLLILPLQLITVKLGGNESKDQQLSLVY